MPRAFAALGLVLLAAVLFLPARATFARVRPYILREKSFYVTEHYSDHTSEEIEHDVLDLYRRRDHKLIWTKTGLQTIAETPEEDPSWSPDGRALIVAFTPLTGGDAGNDISGLLVWREGRPPVIIYNARLGHPDYYWGYRWSPSRRLVALCVGQSGADGDDGNLYNIDTLTGQVFTGPMFIHRFVWVSSTKIRYWQYGFHSRHMRDGSVEGWWYVKRKSQLWRATVSQS